MTAHKYDTKDMDLRLRQAANMGDMEEVKALLENPELSININSYGKLTGQTALHRAAANGFSGIVEYLVSKGANTEIKDIKDKKAADLANERLVKSLHEAISFSKWMFPEEPSGELALQRASQFRERSKAALHTQFAPFFTENNNNAMQYAIQSNWNKAKQKSQFNIVEGYINHALAVQSWVIFLQQAKKENYRLGFPPERVAAAQAYLYAKHPEITAEEIQMAHSDSKKVGGFTFLLINRPVDTLLKDIKSTGALVCDPSKGQVYPTSNIPATTAVSCIDGSPYTYLAANVEGATFLFTPQSATYRTKIVSSTKPPACEGLELKTASLAAKCNEHRTAIGELITEYEKSLLAGKTFATSSLQENSRTGGRGR